MSTVNERITIRLEKAEIEAVEDFVQSRKEFSNRSKLFRAAVKEYIENQLKVEPEEIVKLKLPRRILRTIDTLVNDGYFASREEAICSFVREYLTAEKVKAMKASAEELGKVAGEVVSAELLKK